AIARALVHGPRLLVCDEPTSALDHATGQKVMELLREVAAGSDLSLVVVTHDARIFEFADRIAQMDDGHIVGISSGKGQVPADHPMANGNGKCPPRRRAARSKARGDPMIRPSLIPLLAIGGVLFAVVTVLAGSRPPPAAPPVIEPPRAPYPSFVA